VDKYHELSKVAVEDLLSTCPEFRCSWDANAWLIEDDEGGVGLYGVFGHIVLPFLSYALSAVRRSASSPSESGCNTEERFRQNPEWSDIPDSTSPKFEDLLRRLYEVLERWASSPNKHIREAVYIELIESGYDTLSVDDLTSRAGPILRSLKTAT
jgi:hypothetical protein